MESESKLKAARLHWQLGRWESLASIDIAVPTDGKMTDGETELALYKSQALFQVRERDEAIRFVRALKAAGVDKNLIMESLWSGAQSALARGWMMTGKKVNADVAIKAAIERNPECGDPAAVAALRSGVEWATARKSIHEGAIYSAPQRKLFVDCGGYDGCSALKFLLTFPEFEAVTFEPNADLWRYYEGLPTQLIKKAVHVYDGHVSFRIDAVDGDGSSLIESKVVDYYQQMSNEESPLISVPCVDLSAFIAESAEKYDKIVLKLDVEGAEYDILEKMLEDGTLSFVDQLYCEFHHDKIDIAFERHREILARARAVTTVEPWDANYSVFKLAPKDKEEQRAMRKKIVEDITRMKRKMLKLLW